MLARRTSHQRSRSRCFCGTPPAAWPARIAWHAVRAGGSFGARPPRSLPRLSLLLASSNFSPRSSSPRHVDGEKCEAGGSRFSRRRRPELTQAFPSAPCARRAPAATPCSSCRATRARSTPTTCCCAADLAQHDRRTARCNAGSDTKLSSAAARRRRSSRRTRRSRDGALRSSCMLGLVSASLAAFDGRAATTRAASCGISTWLCFVGRRTDVGRPVAVPRQLRARPPVGPCTSSSDK